MFPPRLVRSYILHEVFLLHMLKQIFLDDKTTEDSYFTKDYFGPKSTRSFFWSIGRIFAKMVNCF